MSNLFSLKTVGRSHFQVFFNSDFRNFSAPSMMVFRLKKTMMEGESNDQPNRATYRIAHFFHMSDIIIPTKYTRGSVEKETLSYSASS
jgi:hypothetical protein